MREESIYITEPGTFLGKKSRRLIIRRKESPDEEISLLHAFRTYI